jgi:hypothetical protein
MLVACLLTAAFLLMGVAQRFMTGSTGRRH